MISTESASTVMDISTDWALVRMGAAHRTVTETTSAAADSIPTVVRRG